MAVQLGYDPNRIRRAITQRVRAGALRRKPIALPKIQNQVRPPAYVGPTVSPEELARRRAMGDYGDVGGAIGHPATSEAPPAPSQVPLPPPGGGGIGPIGAPGRGTGILSWNPQLILPDTALASYGAIDSEYAADKNEAITNYETAYHKTLQDLGYMDPQGHYIEGNIDLGYRREHALGQQNLADEYTASTNDARAAGLLFSGLRARNLEQDQRETVRQLADLDLNTSRARIQGGSELDTAQSDFTRAIIQAYNEAMFRKFGTYDYSYKAPPAPQQ